MKKLLFVITQLFKVGAETSLINFVNMLDKTPYDISLIVLNQEKVLNIISLLDKLHPNIHVCDVYEEYQKCTLRNRLKAKLLYSSEQKTAFLFPALDFARNKECDWAFSVGEWYLPSFVATQVNTKKGCMATLCFRSSQLL